MMSEVSGQFIYSEGLYRLPPKVIVLLPVPWETLPENDTALLGKILGSVKLSLAAVQILHSPKTDLRKLIPLNPSVVISFGASVQPESAPYTVHEAEGLKIIQSDALSSLDDARKKNLWAALKQVFA